MPWFDLSTTSLVHIRISESDGGTACGNLLFKFWAVHSKDGRGRHGQPKFNKPSSLLNSILRHVSKNLKRHSTIYQYCSWNMSATTSLLRIVRRFDSADARAITLQQDLTTRWLSCAWSNASNSMQLLLPLWAFTRSTSMIGAVLWWGAALLRLVRSSISLIFAFQSTLAAVRYVVLFLLDTIILWKC